MGGQIIDAAVSIHQAVGPGLLDEEDCLTAYGGGVGR